MTDARTGADAQSVEENDSGEVGSLFKQCLFYISEVYSSFIVLQKCVREIGEH